MPKMNKSTKDIDDLVKPFTLTISNALWEKFKTLATAKAMTYNDYVVAMISAEVHSKADALKEMQS